MTISNSSLGLGLGLGLAFIAGLLVAMFLRGRTMRKTRVGSIPSKYERGRIWEVTKYRFVFVQEKEQITISGLHIREQEIRCHFDKIVLMKSTN